MSWSQQTLTPSRLAAFRPLPYLLPALGIGASRTVGQALWAARLASALPCLAFIALAFWLLWTESTWSVLGLLAAVTPTTLFIDSVVNPNGLEIAAALAFAAAMLRISRSSGSVSGWIYLGAAVSGAATLLAWQLGWLFVGADLLLLAALLGRSGLATLTRRHRRAVAFIAAVLVVAFVLFLVYGLSAGTLHGAFGVTPVGPSLRQGLVQLRNALSGAVGLFGALTVPLPRHSDWVWWLLVLVIAGGGLILAGWRDRLALLLIGLLVLAFPVLFFAWVYRHSGFGLQPRYVMPLLALIPLVGGEFVFRHRRRLPAAAARWLPLLGLAVVAGFQLFAWWINAADSAGRPYAISFLSHPLWSPPLGCGPWTAIAIIGAGLLFAVGVCEARPVLWPLLHQRSRQPALRR